MVLEMQSKDLSESLQTSAHIKLHQQQCSSPRCLCRNGNEATRPDFLLRLLFLRADSRSSETQTTTFKEVYFDYLLGEDQTVSAIHYLSQWHPNSFFGWVAKRRCEGKCAAFLAAADCCNKY
jgi:hypothetical protein